MSRWAWVAAGLLGGLVAAVAVALGAWWLTFVLGVAIGIMVTGRAAALGAGALLGLVGWAAPLLALALAGDPVERAAVVLSSILGAAAGGVPALALTVVTGVLLALSGAWLGSAARLARVRAR